MSFAIVGLIAFALAFDFLNGFHDSANFHSHSRFNPRARPRYAVIWAAFFNSSLPRLRTSRRDRWGRGSSTYRSWTSPLSSDPRGGCCWNIITWFSVCPPAVARPHRGMIGLRLVKTGRARSCSTESRNGGVHLRVAWRACARFPFRDRVQWHSGKALGGVDHVFRKGQLVSAAALYSMGHGGNDAQKRWESSRGFCLVPASGGTFTSPLGRASCTRRSRSAPCSAGADRQDDGQKVAKLKPVDGFCASPALPSCCSYRHTSNPGEQTHTITGAIMVSVRSSA